MDPRARLPPGARRARSSCSSAATASACPCSASTRAIAPCPRRAHHRHGRRRRAPRDARSRGSPRRWTASCSASAPRSAAPSRRPATRPSCSSTATRPTTRSGAPSTPRRHVRLCRVLPGPSRPRPPTGCATASSPPHDAASRSSLLLDGYGSFWIRRRWVRSARRGGRGGRLLPAGAAALLPADEPAQPPQDRRGRRRDRVHRRHQRRRRVPRRGAARGATCTSRSKGPPRSSPRPRLRAGLALRDAARDPRAGAPTRPAIGAAAARRRSPSCAAAPTSRAPSARRSTASSSARSRIARSRVYITTPYFIPDRAIVVALQTAALRGVDVRLLFPSKSNHPFVFQAGRSFYEELLEAGVSRSTSTGPG